MAEDWIDISVPLHTGMAHWPDNPPVLIERMDDIDRGDSANVSKPSLFPANRPAYRRRP